MDTATVTALEKPTLHLLCGKIASGKSTLSARLGSLPGTVIVSEDYWLAALFADEMQSISDYVQYSSRHQKCYEASSGVTTQNWFISRSGFSGKHIVNG